MQGAGQWEADMQVREYGVRVWSTEYLCRSNCMEYGVYGVHEPYPMHPLARPPTGSYGARRTDYIPQASTTIATVLFLLPD